MPVHKHDGTWMGPNPPTHKGPASTPKYEASGEDAGGTENLKADGHKYRADAKTVPQSGSAKFRPAGVTVHSGVAAPHSVATKPAGKTKSPQNAT